MKILNRYGVIEHCVKSQTWISILTPLLNSHMIVAEVFNVTENIVLYKRLLRTSFLVYLLQLWPSEVSS